MKEYSKTKVYAVETEADGSQVRNKKGEPDTYITSETAFNVQLKKATEAKEPLPQILATGTFGYKAAETVDEAVVLCGGNGVGEYENIEVFLGVFNYAASLRQDNFANDILSAESFAAWEGVRDVSSAIAQKVERSKMTNEEVAIRALAKGGIVITPEQLRAALAMIAQGGAQSATA